MSIFKKIANFFNPLIRWLKNFFKELFARLCEEAFAEIMKIALSVVTELVNSDLSNEGKRKEAFIRIKQLAVVKGIEAKDHLINIAIEMAVAKIKF